jgi:hypothetical protein
LLYHTAMCFDTTYFVLFSFVILASLYLYSSTSFRDLQHQNKSGCSSTHHLQ